MTFLLFLRKVSTDLSIHYLFNLDSESYFFADQISMADGELLSYWWRHLTLALMSSHPFPPVNKQNNKIMKVPSAVCLRLITKT